MATLNITYNGLSADYPRAIDRKVGDRDIRRIAAEVVRSGGVPGLWIANLPESAFDTHVVDRFPGKANNGDERIYLRPRVPFG